MKKIGKLPLVNKIIIGTSILAVVGVTYLAIAQPLMLQFVAEKINSIITPKPSIGNLTPARDIVGTWRSSLAGKGLQLYGLFELPGSTTTLYEDGDIELIINEVKNNVAYGKMRYPKICSWGTSTITIPGNKKIINIPKTCFDTEYTDIQIRVSSSALDFGTISVGEIKTSMQGSFTSDLMSGSMTMTSDYGVIKGVFTLSRQKE